MDSNQSHFSPLFNLLVKDINVSITTIQYGQSTVKILLTLVQILIRCQINSPGGSIVPISTSLISGIKITQVCLMGIRVGKSNHFYDLGFKK